MMVLLRPKAETGEQEGKDGFGFFFGDEERVIRLERKWLPKGEALLGVAFLEEEYHCRVKLLRSFLKLPSG